MIKQSKFEKYLMERGSFTPEQVKTVTELIGSFITSNLKQSNECVITNVLKVRFKPAKNGVEAKLNRQLVSRIVTYKKLNSCKIDQVIPRKAAKKPCYFT